MKITWWIVALVAALSLSGCKRLFESSEHKLFREHLEAVNTFCDKLEGAKSQADFKAAMEWMGKEVQPRALKIQALVREDPQAFARVLKEDPEMVKEMQKVSARMAAVMMKAMTRMQGGEGLAALRGLLGGMLGQPGAGQQDIAKLAEGLLKQVAGQGQPKKQAEGLTQKARGLLQKMFGKHEGDKPATPKQPVTTTWRPPPTIQDIPRSNGAVGVTECDTLLEKMRACAEAKVPAFQRQALLDSARQWSDSWMTSGRTFAGRRALKTICKRQREAQAKTLGK